MHWYSAGARDVAVPVFAECNLLQERESKAGDDRGAQGRHGRRCVLGGGLMELGRKEPKRQSQRLVATELRGWQAFTQIAWHPDPRRPALRTAGTHSSAVPGSCSRENQCSRRRAQCVSREHAVWS